MSVNRRVLHFLVENPLLILLIIMVLASQLLTGTALTPSNLRGVSLDAAIIAIAAAPSAMLIVAGYIDFSIGSTLAISAVAAGLAMQHLGNAALAIILALAVGAVVGVINAFFTTILRLSPFVTTLGMMTALRGAAQLLSPLPISNFGPAFGFLGIGTIAGVPLSVYFAAIVFGICAVFLTLTPAGRHVYAIGVSPEAAFMSGLKVRAIPFLLYVASGMAAGLAGAVTAARLNSAPAGQIGSGFEMSVITAVLLGGVALTGGVGTIFDVLVGVLFMGFLNNTLVLLNVPDFWQSVASGLALVAAIALGLGTGRLRHLLITRDARAAATSAAAPALARG